MAARRPASISVRLGSALRLPPAIQSHRDGRRLLIRTLGAGSVGSLLLVAALRPSTESLLVFGFFAVAYLLLDFELDEPSAVRPRN